MNIELIKSRFTPEMLGAIKNEVDTFVQERFTLDDYTINKHLIDTFFIQPIFYSTLLNYYTMYEQRSTLSLSDIYSDDAISPTKKDAYFASFAADIGINTTNMSSEDMVSAIENRLTVSDTRIHSDMMRIVKQYDKAIDGATGVFWTMFRNSPDHMYFSHNKFGAAMMYEDLVSEVEIVDIMNQPITMGDIEKYRTMSNSGRVTNFIDIYVDTHTFKEQLVITLADGETDTYVLPAKKWKKIEVSEADKNNIKCTNMEGGYIGFASRSITFEAKGPLNTVINLESYLDDVVVEDQVKSDNPTYDIEFFGLLPVYVDIKLQNQNSIARVASYLGTPLDGSKWTMKVSELSRVLQKSGNSIVGMDAVIWINPLISKKISIYNNNLALSPKSIFSWIDIDNTCIKASTITDLETGDVTSL